MVLEHSIMKIKTRYQTYDMNKNCETILDIRNINMRSAM